MNCFVVRLQSFDEFSLVKETILGAILSKLLNGAAMNLLDNLVTVLLLSEPGYGS